MMIVYTVGCKLMTMLNTVGCKLIIQYKVNLCKYSVYYERCLSKVYKNNQKHYKPRKDTSSLHCKDVKRGQSIALHH